VAWLKLIVKDQANYHRDNYLKLHKAESRLRTITHLVFLATFIAVGAHFFISKDWPPLLFFTAAGPALAAALHGAGTRLGVVHRIALSEETEPELNSIHENLENFDGAALPGEQGWRQLRELTLRAAIAMGSENTSWHQLVRREQDDFV
jgi:hypothetical protein